MGEVLKFHKLVFEGLDRLKALEIIIWHNYVGLAINIR